MTETVNSDTLEKFISRVIEIEEKPAFLKKGQKSAREEEILH
mgnify:FL=1